MLLRRGTCDTLVVHVGTRALLTSCCIVVYFLHVWTVQQRWQDWASVLFALTCGSFLLSITSTLVDIGECVALR